MPRTCTICRHPDRALIDDALLAGTPYRAVAGRYHVSKSALERHKAEHLPRHLSQARGAAEVVQADSLLGRLQELNSETRAILSEAKDGGNNELALKAIARVEKQLELEAKLLAYLEEREREKQPGVIGIEVHTLSEEERQARIEEIFERARKRRDEQLGGPG